MAELLPGAPVAERLTQDLKARSDALRQRGVAPTLAIIRVGRVPGGELVWYVLAILVGIAYLLLTVGAPDIGPFADPAAAAMGTIPF